MNIKVDTKAFEKKKQEFLSEYESAVAPLIKKYNMVIVPVLRYTEVGIQPVFAVDIVHEKQSEPETDGHADTDHKAPAE